MKRLYCIATAALVLAASGVSAQAGTEITLNGYCNAWIITNLAKGVHALGAAPGSCDSAKAEGGDKKQKHGYVNAEMGGIPFSSSGNLLYVYEIELPLHSGGTWDIYTSSDGINFQYSNGGNYTVKTDKMRGPYVGPNALALPATAAR